jgi:hypothetical protein
MVNFAADPLPFTLASVFIEDGGPHRRPRCNVFVRGSIPKAHEDCVIAVTNGVISPAQRQQLLHDIAHYITAEVQLHVRQSALHPHGIAIFRMRNACQRDTLVNLNPHFIGLRQIMFYPHDEVPINARRFSFSRKRWLMLSGFPLDFKDSAILSQCCAPFAKVVHWYADDPSLSRVLIKVIVEDPLDIPRSLIIKVGKESDGEGRSWTVSVYIFNSELIPTGPANDPIVPGEQQLVEQMADEFMADLPQQNQDIIPDQGSNVASGINEVEMEVNSTTTALLRSEPS